MWPNQKIILGEHALGMKIKQQVENFVPGKFQSFHLNQCIFAYVISSIIEVCQIEPCSEFIMENAKTIAGLLKKKKKIWTDVSFEGFGGGEGWTLSKLFLIHFGKGKFLVFF